jgi:hypothetical protein
MMTSCGRTLKVRVEFFARKSAESPVDPEILRLEAEAREEVEAEARKQVEDALNEDRWIWTRTRELSMIMMPHLLVWLELCKSKMTQLPP